jgi:hypothetical protein
LRSRPDIIRFFPFAVAEFGAPGGDAMVFLDKVGKVGSRL